MEQTVGTMNPLNPFGLARSRNTTEVPIRLTHYSRPTTQRVVRQAVARPASEMVTRQTVVRPATEMIARQKVVRPATEMIARQAVARPAMGIVMNEDGTVADLATLVPARQSDASRLSSKKQQKQTALYVGMALSIIATIGCCAAAVLVFLSGNNA